VKKKLIFMPIAAITANNIAALPILAAYGTRLQINIFYHHHPRDRPSPITQIRLVYNHRITDDHAPRFLLQRP
jgi:hypothetical protein